MVTHQQAWRRLQMFSYNINPSPMTKLDWLTENGIEISKEDAIENYDTLKTSLNVMLLYQEFDLYKHIVGLSFSKEAMATFMNAEPTVSVWLVPIATLMKYGIGTRCLLPAAQSGTFDLLDRLTVERKFKDGETLGEILLAV